MNRSGNEAKLKSFFILMILVLSLCFGYLLGLSNSVSCFTEPSSAEIVFNQSTKNLECSSSSEKRKRMPQEKPISSEVHPKANSWSVPTRVLTDEAHTTEVVTGALPPSLNVKPVANNVAAAQRTNISLTPRDQNMDEYGFVIRQNMVLINSGSVRTDL
nr:hypothetical protein [Tanacetum cinerariifolium]